MRYPARWKQAVAQRRLLLCVNSLLIVVVDCFVLGTAPVALIGCRRDRLDNLYRLPLHFKLPLFSRTIHCFSTGAAM